jgi:hypothetical protein
MAESRFNRFKEYKEMKIPYGEQKVFQLINITNDPDNPGKKLCPRLFIAARATLMVKGEVEEIACYHSMGADDIPALDHEISFSPESAGRLMLNSTSARDQKRYAFLMFTSDNRDSPYRDEKVPAKFFLVNPKRDAEKALQERIDKNRAESAILNASKMELERVSEILRIKGTHFEDTKHKLDGFSQTNRSAFLAALDEALKGPAKKEKAVEVVEASVASEDLITEARVKELIADGTLVTDAVKKAVRYEDKVIFDFSKGNVKFTPKALTNAINEDDDLISSLIG